ncbi:MAG: TldD/PmbA family protein, partial [Terriglobia bacterium]
MPLRPDELKALAEKVLKLVRAEEAAVRLAATQNCNTRFANNSITTAGLTGDLSINLTVTRERKSGSVTVTELSDDALARAARQAEAIAEVTPPDPEHVAPLGPQDYPEINTFHQQSARARSADILPGVRAVIGAAEKKKVNAFGFYSVTTRARAIANRRGLYGFHRSTWVSYSVTARTLDATGSGWAAQASPRISEIDGGEVGRVAIRKAVESQRPRRLEPGKYAVILEPAALSGLLPFLAFSFSARAADEGRSFLSKRGGGNQLGEKLFGENVTLRSDPFDTRVPGRPWGDEDWLPAEKINWIEKGVVRNLLYDRYWAQKSEKRPTPSPSNLIMDGGTASLEGLIASTERGLLVTRFWYIRFLQPQTVQLTGLTRDGLFYIENGKIKHPVMNFRFNESVVNLLNNVEAMTSAVPVDGGFFLSMVLPAI